MKLGCIMIDIYTARAKKPSKEALAAYHVLEECGLFEGRKGAPSPWIEQIYRQEKMRLGLSDAEMIAHFKKVGVSFVKLQDVFTSGES
jgi:hypothetical protein